MNRRPFDVALAVVAAVVLAFLLLPLVAIFARTSPGALWASITGPAARGALAVSLQTSVVAHVLILGLGTPIAYALAVEQWPGRRLAVAVVELPLVLPPAVAGIGLLAAFGRLGLVGRHLDALGVEIAFTRVAVVLAVAFVAGPLYVRQAVAAFQSVDSDLLDAARTLGARPHRTFVRVAVPLAAGGLGAGSALAWARGLGEFGATIMFAGSFQGTTRTLPLAIYSEFPRDFEVALAIGALLVLVSAAVLVAVKLLLSWRSSQSTSLWPFRPSSSS